MKLSFLSSSAGVHAKQRKFPSTGVYSVAEPKILRKQGGGGMPLCREKYLSSTQSGINFLQGLMSYFARLMGLTECKFTTG